MIQVLTDQMVQFIWNLIQQTKIINFFLFYSKAAQKRRIDCGAPERQALLCKIRSQSVQNVLQIVPASAWRGWTTFRQETGLVQLSPNESRQSQFYHRQCLLNIIQLLWLNLISQASELCLLRIKNFKGFNFSIFCLWFRNCFEKQLVKLRIGLTKE